MSELEKFADAVPSMQVIREFLDWCEEQKMELAVPREHGNWLQPVNEGREQMFARYFGFDSVKLENERMDLLKRHSEFVKSGSVRGRADG